MATIRVPFRLVRTHLVARLARPDRGAVRRTAVTAPPVPVPSRPPRAMPRGGGWPTALVVGASALGSVGLPARLDVPRHRAASVGRDPAVGPTSPSVAFGALPAPGVLASLAVIGALAIIGLAWSYAGGSLLAALSRRRRTARSA
jgi:hypothetical protein